MALEGAPTVVERRSSRRWVIVVALAVVLLLVIGYVVGGAAAAAGPVSRSDKALKTAVDHNNTMADMFKNDPFKKIDVTSNSADIGGAKKAVAAVNTQIATWQVLVNGDRASLEQARAELNSSILTLPEKSTIDSHRRRVEAGLSAMTTAQKGIDIFRKQFTFFDAFVDVAAGFDAIGKAGDANDVGAMQSSLATTAASLQKAVALAKDSASIPPAFSAPLAPMQKMVSDMQALVAAVQAGNFSAAQASVATVEADAKALENVDMSGVDKAETALIQPLSDEYDRQMKIAAGS